MQLTLEMNVRSLPFCKAGFRLTIATAKLCKELLREIVRIVLIFLTRMVQILSFVVARLVVLWLLQHVVG